MKILFQMAKAKAKVEDEPDKSESMKLPLGLTGFSNGSALSDVRQRVAGAVATQWPSWNYDKQTVQVIVHHRLNHAADFTDDSKV